MKTKSHHFVLAICLLFACSHADAGIRPGRYRGVYSFDNSITNLRGEVVASSNSEFDPNFAVRINARARRGVGPNRQAINIFLAFLDTTPSSDKFYVNVSGRAAGDDGSPRSFKILGFGPPIITSNSYSTRAQTMFFGYPAQIIARAHSPTPNRLDITIRIRTSVRSPFGRYSVFRFSGRL
jgi:hypothetical protein